MMKLNINTNKPYENEADAFLSKLEVSWDKGKDEIWNNIMEPAIEKDEKPIRRIGLHKVYYSAAAVLIILISSTLFLNTYKTTVHSLPGQRAEVMLPDGSLVLLNAESNLSYKPYWWRFSRETTLNGEAFFEVKKGERFDVISANGTTSVLGTSFNVFSRGNSFAVTCATGSVKVKLATSTTEIVLKPNQQAKLAKQGELELRTNVNVKHISAWKNKTFVFTGDPVSNVFRELELQYGVSIHASNTQGLNYTGNFPGKLSIEEALNLVCTPLALNFVKTGNKAYTIVKQ